VIVMSAAQFYVVDEARLKRVVFVWDGERLVAGYTGPWGCHLDWELRIEGTVMVVVVVVVVVVGIERGM